MEQTETIKKYGVKEAAARLGVHPFTLHRMVRHREIAFYRPRDRGPIFFFESQLSDFERQRTFEPRSAVLP